MISGYENKIIKGYEMKKLTFKLNSPLQNKPVGSTISLECENGVPVEKYWRDRFNDAKTDNCIELVKRTTAKKTQTEVKDNA